MNNSGKPALADFKLDRKQTVAAGLIGAFLGLVYLLFKYHYGDVNHIEQLPQLFRTLSPSYLKEDFFVNSTEGISPRYYFNQFAAFFVNMGMSIETLYFLLTLVSNMALGSICVLFARKLTGSLTGAIIATALIFFHRGANIGRAADIPTPYLVPGQLMMPFVLGAVWALFSGRYLTAFACCLIPLPFHPVISVQTAGLVFVAGGIRLLLQRNWSQLLLNTGYLGVCYLFMTILFQPFMSLPHISSKEFIDILARFRHPHHYLPSQFFSSDYVKAAGLFAITLLCLKYCRKEFSTWLKTAAIVSACILLFCFAGYVFSEWIPLRSVLSMQVYRLFAIINLICFTIIGGCIGLAVDKGLALKKVSQRAVMLTLGGASIVCLAIGLAVFIRNWPNRMHIPENRKAILAQIPRLTPHDSVLLAPYDFGEIRVFCPRALVVDWKGFPFADLAMQEWYSRIVRCYGTKDMDKNYRQITDSQIKALCADYHAQFVVLYADTPTALPVLYADKYFKLLRLPEKLSGSSDNH